MKHTPPPPPRWFWFAAVVSLAVLASLTIAAGRATAPGAQAPTEPASSTDAETRSAATLLDSSPASDRRCLLCQPPLY